MTAIRAMELSKEMMEGESGTTSSCSCPSWLAAALRQFTLGSIGRFLPELYMQATYAEFLCRHAQQGPCHGASTTDELGGFCAMIF